MQPTFRLDLCSAAGVKYAELSDFLELSAAVRINTAGVLKTVLRGDHPALAALENNGQVELFYKYEGGSWTRFFGGVYRAQKRNQPNEPYFTLTAIGYLWLLKTRIVAYPSLMANKSYFAAVKAETIMKALVTANITAAATTANGRIRNGDNWPATVISVEADAAGGNTTEWYCAQENVLGTLQKLAKIGGGDFDLVKTAANAFEFRFYTGQIGSNRTGSVVFSIGHGNMGEPEYGYDRLDEVTAVIVGGLGEDAAREFVARVGIGFAVGNDIETFVAATDVELGNTDGLNAAGDMALIVKMARETFAFEILQIPAMRFGSEYFLGDLVTAVNPYTGASVTQKIMGVGVTLQKNGDATFSVELETP